MEQSEEADKCDMFEVLDWDDVVDDDEYNVFEVEGVGDWKCKIKSLSPSSSLTLFSAIVWSDIVE